MLEKDYTAKLLNLEDVIITKVENISEEVHVYLELPRTKHRCPACGALTDRVHDYRMGERNVTQQGLTKACDISPSVISDYVGIRKKANLGYQKWTNFY